MGNKLCGVSDDSCVAGCAITSVITLIVLIPSLIGTAMLRVPDSERAVVWNDVTQEFVGVRSPGLHALSPGVRAAHFSRRVISKLPPTITCLTSDGVSADITLEVQYAYHGQDTDMISLFREVGTDSDVWQWLHSIAVHETLVACGNLTSNDIHTDRGRSELAINNNIKAGLNAVDFGVIGENAPISNFQLPQDLLDEMNAKDSATENVALAMSERDPALIDADTALQTAQYQKENILITARQNADLVIFTAQQKQETVIAELTALATEFAVTTAQLNVTPAVLLTDVLMIKLRGNEQSARMQLCLSDCRRTGATFSCATCYLTDGTTSGQTIITAP
jgi:hypothetical protein